MELVERKGINHIDATPLVAHANGTQVRVVAQASAFLFVLGLAMV